MSELESVDGVVEFKDRKVWLFVFGICQCILGIMSGLAIPMMIFGIVIVAMNPEAVDGSKTSAMQLIPALLVYAGGAAWFITLGIGSIRCRRWARALTLVTSWMWLCGGVIGLAFMIFLMPVIFSSMNTGENELPPAFYTIMTIVMIGFMSVVYVILPLVLVLFYGSKHVKATCERWDEKIRWTDKCPLPVLAISIMLGIWAISMPCAGFQNWLFLFFGIVLDSYLAAAVVVCASALSALLAWRLYKLDIRALWATIVFICVWFTSMTVTFLGDSIWEYYEKLNMQPEQIEVFKGNGGMLTAMVIMIGVWAVCLIGYLIYIMRYFKKDCLDSSVLSVEQL